MNNRHTKLLYTASIIALATIGMLIGSLHYRLNQNQHDTQQLQSVQESNFALIEEQLLLETNMLRRQLDQLNAEHARLARQNEQAREILYARIEQLENGLDNTTYSWKLEQLNAGIARVEQAIYLRQSESLIQHLIDEMQRLIALLPPSQSTLLENALSQDRQARNNPQPSIGQNLAQLQELQTLLQSLPQPCCLLTTTPALPEQHSQSWLDILTQAFRLQRLADIVPIAEPNATEKMLLRLSMGLQIARARHALWNYNQKEWGLALSQIQADAQRALQHDPSGLQKLLKMVKGLQIKNVEPVRFEFNALKSTLTSTKPS
ncbi:MAG: hypothetical protein ACR2PW_08345 [Gammaproteobacteria bacterium]